MDLSYLDTYLSIPALLLPRALCLSQVVQPENITLGSGAGMSTRKVGHAQGFARPALGATGCRLPTYQWRRQDGVAPSRFCLDGWLSGKRGIWSAGVEKTKNLEDVDGSSEIVQLFDHGLCSQTEFDKGSKTYLVTIIISEKSDILPLPTSAPHGLNLFIDLLEGVPHLDPDHLEIGGDAHLDIADLEGDVFVDYLTNLGKSDLWSVTGVRLGVVRALI